MFILYEYAIYSKICRKLYRNWNGLNYKCNAKYKALGNGKICFPLQRHLVSFEYFFFVLGSFVLISICISVSLLGDRNAL